MATQKSPVSIMPTWQEAHLPPPESNPSHLYTEDSQTQLTSYLDANRPSDLKAFREESPYNTIGKK